jgi:hypothetical protein
MTAANPPTEKVTASAIRRAMAKKWAAPEYALFYEVGLGPGAVERQRRADVVMMSLWPSRGLELHGVEIKVSRADWRREALDPSKAEAIATFCDRWWVHIAPGVIQDLSEVPVTWGVREFDGRVWRTLREAEKLQPQPLTRSLLAALLRRADEAHRRIAADEARDALAKEREELTKQRETMGKEIEAAVARKTVGLLRAQETIKAFEGASGVSLSDAFGNMDPATVGALILAIRRAGIAGTWTGLGRLAQSLRKLADDLHLEVENFGLAQRDDASAMPKEVG